MKATILSDYRPTVANGHSPKIPGDIVFGTALRRRGHEATIVNADLGLRYPGALGGDVIALLPVRKAWNEDVKGFLRLARPQTIVWDCGGAQLPLVEDILGRGTVDCIQLCRSKTHTLTAKTGAAAARALAQIAHPATLILVTGPAGGWAARHGKPVVEVPTERIEPPVGNDGCGCGAAWLAGFTASICSAPEQGVAGAMRGAHLTATEFIRSGVGGLPTNETLEALRESFLQTHPRRPRLAHWLRRAAAFIS